MHLFRDDLARSHRASASPLWEEIYRLAFPDFHSLAFVEDRALQRQGVDRLVTLTTGAVVKIEEKQRNKDYDDILLEIWSDAEKRKKGWAVKPSASDFLMYVFNPSHRCYLLPFGVLRRATVANAREWRDAYGWRDAKNERYTTRSIPVPIPVLQEKVPAMRCFRF